MAADFWSSSHYKRWMVDRASIAQARAVDALYVDNDDPKYFDFLNIYFANAIMKLGRKLTLRQRVIATAIIFFKRFYLKNSYCETDPFLVISACCYLAAKAEECPVSIKLVASESKALFTQEIYNVKSTNFDHTRIAEMEFYLVDDLESDLTIYHPYRTLTALCKPDPSSSPSSNSTAATTTTTANTNTNTNTNPTLPDTEPEEGEAIEYPSPSSGTHTLNPSLNHPIDEGPRYWGTGQGQLELPDGGFQHAWFIVNDTYRSNICVIYPPHLIAVAAICLTVVFHPPSRAEIAPHLPSSSSSTTKVGQPPDTILTFLASLNVSFPLVATIIQEIVSLWTLWDRYKEDSTDTSSATSPGGGKSSSLSPTKSHQQQLQHRLARGSATASTTLSALSTSTPTSTAGGGGDDPVSTTDSNDTTSHSPSVEEPAILFTPSILSNILVKMREARLAVVQQATSSNSGSSSNNNTDGGSNNAGSGSTTPGIGKAANKMLERTQAAG